jgi:hypothetical protein
MEVLALLSTSMPTGTTGNASRQQTTPADDKQHQQWTTNNTNSANVTNANTTTN